MKAALQRERRQKRFAAAMTANIMNCFGPKKPITVEMLLEGKSADRQRKRRKSSEVEQAKFNALCRDGSKNPIWAKLDEASKRAEAQRRADGHGKQAQTTRKRV